jgi:uncharacterized repeat protein (TIGR04138 family)
MADITFEEAIQRAYERDPRYIAGAYEFVRDALHISVEKFRGGDEAQHVSGQELLEGVKELALKEFGPMALTILNTWGLYQGIDVGNIVYNLIEVGYFGRSDGDSLDDFSDGFDWEHAFAQPFLPKRLQSVIPSKKAA